MPGYSLALDQCSEETRTEFKKDDVPQGYFRTRIRKGENRWDKAKCFCSVDFVIGQETVGRYSISGSSVQYKTVTFNSPIDPLYGQDFFRDNGNFSKTFKWLDNYVSQNNSCPTSEAEFELIKKIRFDELEQFTKAQELKNREKIDRETKEREARKIEISKVCKELPKINQEVIEKISATVKVDPQSIRLNRVYVNDFNNCTAIFYTGRGAIQAIVGFNKNGLMISAENFNWRN